ncbi:MAG: DUF2946 family protein [Burkholderiaceae bacterium]
MYSRSILQTLCRATALARWVLLGFVLSLGVAIASPIVNPQASQLICSASGGMKIIVTTADGSTEVASQSMDCPLCVSIIAPPPVLKSTFEPVQALSYALQPIPAAILAQRTAAPPPGRGPPHFL